MKHQPVIERFSDPLPVMETFYTIQGEGVYAGHAAWFIRLAGCDVGCVWCDVKESWPVAGHPVRTVADLVAEVLTSPARIVVITGGEPALHDLAPLTGALKKSGLRTHIETSGAAEVHGSWDWVCLSPKKFKLPVAASYDKANELKVVVYHRSDLDWALEQAKHVQPACKLLLQPEWSKSSEVMPLIVDFIMNNPAWQVSLQTHKYMQIP